MFLFQIKVRRAYSRPLLHSTMECCPFCKNYAKLYFDAKHLEKGFNKGGELFDAYFSKKPFFHKSVFLHKKVLLQATSLNF